jgi:hypothetical protein
MPADPPSSPALRASDADRDRVIELLRAAVADGRLDPAEFDERLDAALAARTIDALAPLTADLIAPPGSGGAVALPLAGTPAKPAAELLTINERHGSVRRDGRWTLPHRLVLHTAWSDVMLDLTSAVRTGPELVIDLRVRGGTARPPAIAPPAPLAARPCGRSADECGSGAARCDPFPHSRLLGGECRGWEGGGG